MAEMLQVLDREWSELATSPRARRALMRWSNSHRHLAGHRDLNEVLDARRDPEQREGVMRSLALLAPADEIAARTLLQAVVPGVLTFARRQATDDEFSLEEMMALAWIRIRTYPPQRRGSVAANIVLDVRKQYRMHHGLDHAREAAELPDVFDSCPSVEDQVLGRLFIEQLGNMRRSGVAEIDTLARTRVAGESIESLAAERHLDPRVLCRRRWNLEVRLRSMTLAA